MIHLRPEAFTSLSTPGDLVQSLQIALRLEHATLPPYLYALYSITEGANQDVADIIRSVAMEEMLHFGLVANLINALGARPVIADPAFPMTYPGHLPGSVAPSAWVRLAPASVTLVRDVFMAIEEPEHPLVFPSAFAEAMLPVTIGQFYRAVQQRLVDLGDGVFTGDPSRQVSGPLGLTEIRDVAGAVTAIDTIVFQGEGTTTSPTSGAELAHYYRFAEIVRGRRLVANPDAGPNDPPEARFGYTGSPISLDPAGVLPVVENPRRDQYPAGSLARQKAEEFVRAYTGLLQALQTAFDGTPGALSGAIGAMDDVGGLAVEVMGIDLGDGTHAGPTFEYAV